MYIEAWQSLDHGEGIPAMFHYICACGLFGMKWVFWGYKRVCACCVYFCIPGWDLYQVNTTSACDVKTFLVWETHSSLEKQQFDSQPLLALTLCTDFHLIYSDE